MAQNWFPVIDTERCTECGICSDFCPHGVYLKQSGKPVVANPDNCVSGCEGCANRCPNEAIYYFGFSDASGGCGGNCSGCSGCASN